MRPLPAGGGRSARRRRVLCRNSAPSGRSWPAPATRSSCAPSLRSRRSAAGRLSRPSHRRLKRNKPGGIDDLHERAAAVGDDARFVDYVPRTAPGMAVAEAELARRTKILRPRLKEILAGWSPRRTCSRWAGTLLAPRDGRRGRQQLLGQLAEYHRGAPESLGMAPEQLRQALPWQKPVLDALVALLKDAGRVAEARGGWPWPGIGRQWPRPDAAQLEAVEGPSGAVVPPSQHGRAGRED